MTKKLPFYLSIDFEDSYHDTLRELGKKNPDSKDAALKKSYEIIKMVKKRYLNQRPLTFFVTGILAKKHPKLIRKIFEDGNEIGCHYNFHDDINKSNRQNLAKNLDIAIDSISKAIGVKPIGFRAPNFAIDEDNIWAY